MEMDGSGEESGGFMCHEQATCHDTKSSFICSCNDGWSGNGFECVDVDECEHLPCRLQAHAVCDNILGSFVCVCEEGYSDLSNNETCVNMNECTENKHNCDVNSACTDTIGSFYCECNVGFVGNGTQCSDVDECPQARLRDCSGRQYTDAQCTSIPGGAPSCYQLILLWQSDSICDDSKPDLHCSELGCDGTDCVGCNQSQHGAYILETSRGSCSGTLQHCVNTHGSFSCECEDGYVMDHETCVNANECSSAIGLCGSNESCVDTPGSFACECRSGYIFDQSARSCICATKDACEYANEGSIGDTQKNGRTETMDILLPVLIIVGVLLIACGVHITMKNIGERSRRSIGPSETESVTQFNPQTHKNDDSCVKPLEAVTVPEASMNVTLPNREPAKLMLGMISQTSPAALIHPRKPPVFPASPPLMSKLIATENITINRHEIPKQPQYTGQGAAHQLIPKTISQEIEL